MNARFVWSCWFCFVVLAEGPVEAADKNSSVPRWQVFEASFESTASYQNPPQEATLTVSFSGPGGKSANTYGFWDGKNTWKVRFSPTEPGKWTYKTVCSDAANKGLHNQTGEFTCVAPTGTNRFKQHGGIRVSDDLRYFVHEDGTPFFWLGDTAWNGALLSTPEEWATYIKERTRQKFSAVQFVTTQWRASPEGNRNKELAYTGPTNKIQINPAFFAELDKKFQALNDAGLLAVPVMLWAIQGGANPQVNPGVSLSDDQCILLGRYMAGRWGAYKVAWFLGGDSDYRGPKAERWKKIGRAIFNDITHAPVTMHPGGMHWIWEEFKDEKWFGFLGYQSGHGDDEKTLRWLTEGPLTVDWMRLPHKPMINLEPPYENHLAYQSKKPHTPESVRRAIYFSLLNAPTAGVSYGGHGVWGWDDGTKDPTDHPGTGKPMPWQKALTMPGADHMAKLYDFFTGIDFWRLRPTPPFVVQNPGKDNAAKYIACARTDDKDIMVLYVPEDRTVEVKLNSLPPSPNVTWISPKTGEKNAAVGVVTTETVQFPTPAEGDWILFIKTQTEEDKKKEKEAADKAAASKPAEAK